MRQLIILRLRDSIHGHLILPKSRQWIASRERSIEGNEVGNEMHKVRWYTAVGILLPDLETWHVAQLFKDILKSLIQCYILIRVKLTGMYVGGRGVEMENETWNKNILSIWCMRSKTDRQVTFLWNWDAAVLVGNPFPLLRTVISQSILILTESRSGIS
jgi:hypothetical protein